MDNWAKEITAVLPSMVSNQFDYAIKPQRAGGIEIQILDHYIADVATLDYSLPCANNRGYLLFLEEQDLNGLQVQHIDGYMAGLLNHIVAVRSIGSLLAVPSNLLWDHDESKFSKEQLVPYARWHFASDRSDADGYAAAWLTIFTTARTIGSTGYSPTVSSLKDQRPLTGHCPCLHLMSGKWFPTGHHSR